MEQQHETTGISGVGQDATAKAWCPLTGQRVFKSANQAWEIYGQNRYGVSQRTFLTYVGKGKASSPRLDGSYYVEDIEFFAQSKGWPPAPSFVRGATTGGEGESGKNSKGNTDMGAALLHEKVLKARIERAALEMEYDKKRKELLPVKQYEQRLAAAAAVVGASAEAFVYDKVREIIHVCDGKPEKEDSLREYLMREVKSWLHAFSRGEEYEVELIDDESDAGGGHATANLG